MSRERTPRLETRVPGVLWRVKVCFCSCTVFAVGMALERNPEAAKAMLEADWEVASGAQLDGPRFTILVGF